MRQGPLVPPPVPPPTGGARSRRHFLGLCAGALAAVDTGRMALAEAAAPGESWQRLLFESLTLLERDCLYKPTADQISKGILRQLRGMLPKETAARLLQRELGQTGDGLFNAIDAAMAEAAALGPAGPGSGLPVMERALQGYVRSMDRYSDFIPAAAWNLVRTLESEKYIGLGFEMIENARGEFRCYPLPAEAAELAGVRPGDMLLAVDGKPTAGRTRYEVAAAVLGPLGKVSRLELQQDGQAARTVDVTRAVITTSPVQTMESAGEFRIRITRFNEQTARDLAAVLLQLPAGNPLTIDLRGCPGGEFPPSVQCAALFLAEGEEVARLVTNEKERIFGSRTAAPFRSNRLVLLQDGGTASAAELFIAALTADPATRAVSRGQRTFGKGMTQLRYELIAGGALKFTDSRLLGPGGVTWEESGLLPAEEA